jgi:hypothetical protein
MNSEQLGSGIFGKRYVLILNQLEMHIDAKTVQNDKIGTVLD